MNRTATPVATPIRKKIDKPVKPEGSPLYWHPRGYWMCKRFGEEWRYEADHARSLDRYNDEMNARLGKSDPAPDTRKRYYLRDAVNLYLNRQHRRLTDGELSKVQFAKCRLELERELPKAIALNTPLSAFRALGPGDTGPGALFHAIRKRAILRGVQAAHRHIILVRACLDAAAGKRLMLEPDYGEDFDPPTKSRMDKSRYEADIKHGAREWTVDELRKILVAAAVLAQPRATGRGPKPPLNPHLYAQILLALFAGFGSDDCSAVPERAFDEARGIVKFPRVKNDRPRMAWLPPRVWEAMAVSRAHRAQPAGDGAKGLMFLSSSGRKCNAATDKTDAKGILLATGRNDTIGQNFKRLVGRLELHRHRAGFKTLRAMFRTMLIGAGVSNDLIAVVMGRKFSFPVDEFYIRTDLRDQLISIGRHIESQLFPVKQTGSHRSRRSGKPARGAGGASRAPRHSAST